MGDKTNNNIILVLIMVILVVYSLALYYQSKANYFRKELEYQQMKYEILIKEPRIKNIIESGG